MDAFISCYWDGSGAVWSRVTVLVHLKVVYAAVEMLLPQTRHCLQAYRLAYLPNGELLPKHKDLAQAAGTRAWNLSRPAWVHKCQLRGLHRQKERKTQADMLQVIPLISQTQFANAPCFKPMALIVSRVWWLYMVTWAFLQFAKFSD